jgi:hypothetical protein
LHFLISIHTLISKVYLKIYITLKPINRVISRSGLELKHTTGYCNSQMILISACSHSANLQAYASMKISSTPKRTDLRSICSISFTTLSISRDQ